MPRVSSLDNPRLKLAERLISSSRERRKSGRCVLEGEHLVSVYCALHGAPDTVVVADTAQTKPSIRTLLTTLPPQSVLLVSEPIWTAVTQLPVAIAVVAVVMAPRPEFKRAAEFCVLLDDVQDPGNVGSILRSAASAGVAQVFMSPRCAFAWSPKVLRAAQGAHFLLEIFEDVDLVAWIGAYPGATIALVAGGGASLFDVDLRSQVAFAIGSEGTGVSPGVSSAAKIRATIPMPGNFESLNAAAAAAIALFERVRQRGSAGD